jgi:hypothetical protein
MANATRTQTGGKVMTMTEREDIFAKEYLSIKDIAKLFDVCDKKASVLILDMKRRLTIGMGKNLRLSLEGKIHIQDYLDYLGVTADRYSINKGGNEVWQQKAL